MSNEDEDGRLVRDSECRCCLQKCSRSSNSYYLFQTWDPIPSWDCADGTIAADLAKLANIQCFDFFLTGGASGQISELDGFPKFICSGCCLKLHSACQFIWSVRINDQTLQQRLIDNTWPKPIQLENIHGNYVNTNVDIKQEVLTDEEDNMNETEEDMNMILASDIKIEPEEIMEPQPIKVTVNGTITANEMKAQDQKLTNGSSDYERTEYLDATVKEEPISEDEETQCIPPDLPLECMLCSKMLHSISGLKAHVVAQHSYKGVKRKADSNPSPEKKKTKRHKCATCKRSFETSTDLMVHETCHNKCVCYGCHKKLDTFAQLTKHRKWCKASSKKEMQKPKTLEDVMRPLPEEPQTVKKVACPSAITFKCTKCSETFSDLYYMIIHNEIHHSDVQMENNGDIEKNDSSKKNNQAVVAIKSTSTLDKNDEIETEKLKSIFECTNKNKEDSRKMVTDNNVRRNSSEKNDKENSESEVISDGKMQTEKLPSIFDDTKKNNQRKESVTDQIVRINNSKKSDQSTNDLAILKDDKMDTDTLNKNIIERTENNELSRDNVTGNNSSEKSDTAKDESTVLNNDSMETETLVNVVKHTENEDQRENTDTEKNVPRRENTDTEKNVPRNNLDKNEVAGIESPLLNDQKDTAALVPVLEHGDKKEQNQITEYKNYEIASSEKKKQTNDCPNLHKNRIEAEGLGNKDKEQNDSNEDIKKAETNNSKQNEQAKNESAILNENDVETEILESKSEHTENNDLNEERVDEDKENDTIKTVENSIETPTIDNVVQERKESEVMESTDQCERNM